MLGYLAQPFQDGRRPARAASGSNSSPRGVGGRATDLSVKMPCVAVVSHHHLPAGWFRDAPRPGALWHPNPVATRDCPGRSNETRAAGELNYPTNIPQTGVKEPTHHKTYKYKRLSLPGSPGMWTKVRKSKVWPTPHAGPGGMCPQRQASQAGGAAPRSRLDSGAPSPQPLRGSSR